MRRYQSILLSLLSITILLTPIKAQADDIESCRIKASQNQVVSLGFPVRSERLKWFSKVKILVVPFKQKDNPNFTFTNSMRNDYLTAAENISTFSNGHTKIEIVFAPTISTELTNSDMDQLKINQSLYYQKDESKSTFGFVRKFIADHDPELDYTGINAVIIAGSSTSPYSDIAEAFMFWNLPNNDWYRSISTSEGPINNAVLLDNHSNQQTITHEIMHLYGLTDLYGSDSGPGALSLMASNELNLLTYEKWILGWINDSNVQCISVSTSKGISEVSFDVTKDNQLAIINDGNSDPYVIETTKVLGQRYLAFYSLNNDARPPLVFYLQKKNAQNGGVEIQDYKIIGTQFQGPRFTLLVSNFNSTTLTLELASSEYAASVDFQGMISKSLEIKIQIEKEAKAAAAELKAKQEAEAKAALDLIAKQEAEAKAAADLKAKQDASPKPVVIKKITIVCVKGKIIKKIVGVNPKCPSGYIRK